jgi:arsenate reductase (glutaredoxin)
MSEKITVYEKPTCTTCRKLAKFFEENGIEYEKVNYFIEPLSEEKLRDLLAKANLAPADVLRKNEPLYKELNLSAEASPGEIIDLIIRHPSLLQRPIVEVGEKAVLARPVEKVIELIKPQNK